MSTHVKLAGGVVPIAQAVEPQFAVPTASVVTLTVIDTVAPGPRFSVPPGAGCVTLVPAAVIALARRGPGVLASPERIARFVAESEDIDVEMDDPEDLETTEALFTSVTPLWHRLGIVDGKTILTPLGWWGLPKALERAWSPE